MGQQPGSFWEDIVPTVDVARCQRCAECPVVASCLSKAFRRTDPLGPPAVDEGLCFGCYACAGTCPHGAILLPRMH